ncbi:MAG: hypothetical protein HY748_16755 [Elusimicrobia bacterium]|nr:hypothetical protein [Elusimicrobiota bacterium]
MKALWLIALLTLRVHAGSPQRPTTDADKGKLLDAEAHIKLGLQAKEDMETARIEAEEARKRGDKKNQLKYLDKADSQEFGVNFHLSRALELTAEAYHFKPEGEVYVNTGPLAGKKVAWRAKYVDDNAHIREIEKPGGGYHYSQRPPQNINPDFTSLGYTDDYGEIAIRLEAFKLAAKNPAILGSILYHEGVHFEKMTSKEPPTEAEKARPWPRKVDMELAAYEAERKQAKVFNLPKAQATKLERNYQFVVGEAAKAKPIDALAGSPFSPVDKDTQGRYKEWYEIIERGREEIKQEKQKLAESVKEDDISRIRWEVLSIALDACDNPGSMTEERLAVLRDFPPQMFGEAGGSLAENTPEKDRHTCAFKTQLEMYLKLGQGQRLDAGWIKSIRQRYEEKRKRHLDDLLVLAMEMCRDPDKVPESVLQGLAKYDSRFYAGTSRVPDGPFLPCHGEGYRYILDRLARSEPVDRDRMIRLLLFHGGTPPTPPMPAAGYLRTIALHACQSPGSINEKDHIVYLDEWHFPNRRLTYRSYWAEGLTGCAVELYWKLIEYNDAWTYGQTLNPAWLNAEGARLKEKHSKPQPSPGQPVGGDGNGGREPAGGRERIDPKPSLPRNPNWDGRKPH